MIGKWLSAKLPDHSAQFEIGGKTNTVVDAPNLVVQTKQAVAGFAVGIVGNDVENAYSAKLIVQIFALFENGEVVLFNVGVDEVLQ